MKRLLFVIPLFLICALPARAQFEGQIDIKVTTNEGSEARESNISLFLKNDMVASQVTGAGGESRRGRFIVRPDKKVLWIVNDDRKMVFEQSLENNTPSDSTSKPEQRPKPDITKTGKTATILGYSCDEYVSKNEDGETSIWCTSKLGNVFEGLANSMGQMTRSRMRRGGPDWKSEFVDKNLFPLKSVTTKDGKISSTQEVTKIDQRILDASTFEIPEDYKKQSMGMDPSKMMQMMQERMKERMQQQKDDKDKKDDK